MGKKTDKMYMTNSEWAQDFGGFKNKNTTEFKRLPFGYCSLLLTPFENPVTTPDGTVFDLMGIVPWLKKHHTNPCTNEKLESKHLLKLNVTRNDKNELICPITFKVFNEHSHIVAIKQTGNVYSYDAIEKLNFQTKNFRDLLTDEPFTRKDVITLQEYFFLILAHIISKICWIFITSRKANKSNLLISFLQICQKPSQI